MKRKKIITWVLLILLVAGSFGGFYFYKEYNRKQKDTSELKPSFSSSATDLLEEFSKDEKGATAKYLDKVILINGLVKEIQQDEKGFYSVMIGDTSSMSSVVCAIDSTNTSSAAALAKGNKVSMKGICAGYTADDMGIGADLKLIRTVIEEK